ncbi:MAG: NrsF family protein [Vicinamibacteraceae bacterium]
MMTRTDDLIRRLAEDIQPIQALAAPWKRMATWLALSVPFLALAVLVMSPRADLAARLWDSRFLIEQASALATGLAAAAAAFAATVPGSACARLALPLVPLAAWLGTLAHGCVQDWLQFGPDGLSLRPDWICFPAIALIGTGPAIVMTLMLRQGAPLRPRMTMALGGIAAGGLANVGLRLVHAQDASIMVLCWQVGTVFVMSLLAGVMGRSILRWGSTGRSQSLTAF